MSRANLQHIFYSKIPIRYYINISTQTKNSFWLTFYKPHITQTISFSFQLKYCFILLHLPSTLYIPRIKSTVCNVQFWHHFNKKEVEHFEHFSTTSGTFCTSIITMTTSNIAQDLSPYFNLFTNKHFFLSFINTTIPQIQLVNKATRNEAELKIIKLGMNQLWKWHFTDSWNSNPI